MQQILVAVLLLISSATAFVAAPTRGLLSSPWCTTTSHAAAAAAAAAEAVPEELPSVMDGVKGAKLEVIDEVSLAAANYPAQPIAETASVSAVSCYSQSYNYYVLHRLLVFCRLLASLATVSTSQCSPRSLRRSTTAYQRSCVQRPTFLASEKELFHHLLLARFAYYFILTHCVCAAANDSAAYNRAVHCRLSNMQRIQCTDL
jgi:hypothetical protein